MQLLVSAHREHFGPAARGSEGLLPSSPWLFWGIMAVIRSTWVFKLSAPFAWFAAFSNYISGLLRQPV